jgi:hypothetical protein
MWGTISTVAFFLIGNILGSFGVDLLGSALDSIKEGLGMN